MQRKKKKKLPQNNFESLFLTYSDRSYLIFHFITFKKISFLYRPFFVFQTSRNDRIMSVSITYFYTCLFKKIQIIESFVYNFQALLPLWEAKPEQSRDISAQTSLKTLQEKPEHENTQLIRLHKAKPDPNWPQRGSHQPMGPHHPVHPVKPDESGASSLPFESSLPSQLVIIYN